MRNDAEDVDMFKKGVNCLNESVDVPEQCITKKTDKSMCYQEIGITNVYENLDTVENIINSIPEDLLALVQVNKIKTIFSLKYIYNNYIINHVE